MQEMQRKMPAFWKWTALVAAILVIGMPLTGSAQDTLPPQHFFSIRIDDDFLNLAGQGTDRYYTGGDYFRYSILTGVGKKNMFRKVLYSPYTRGASLYSIGATQWVYTPDNLAAKTPVIGDYPYCGVLFLRFTRETISPDGKNLFRSGLSLGVMGPVAMAQEVQSAIHGWINDVGPAGWENQIPDYPVVNYSLYDEPNLFSIGRIIHINGMCTVEAGTLQTDVQLGLDGSISSQTDNFFPAADVKRGSSVKKRKPKFYVQLKPAVKFVGYNSILEGGPFDGRQFYHISPGQINRILFEGTGIMGMRLGDFSIQYRQVIESAEFRTVDQHVYGGFLLVWRI